MRIKWHFIIKHKPQVFSFITEANTFSFYMEAGLRQTFLFLVIRIIFWKSERSLHKLRNTHNSNHVFDHSNRSNCMYMYRALTQIAKLIHQQIYYYDVRLTCNNVTQYCGEGTAHLPSFLRWTARILHINYYVYRNSVNLNSQFACSS